MVVYRMELTRYGVDPKKPVKRVSIPRRGTVKSVPGARAVGGREDSVELGVEDRGQTIERIGRAAHRIELLGLTHQELASSKAQIYGSILRARLNAEPEFLRALVEGEPPEPAKVSTVTTPPSRNGVD